jgi:hypothetical protein
MATVIDQNKKSSIKSMISIKNKFLKEMEEELFFLEKGFSPEKKIEIKEEYKTAFKAVFFKEENYEECEKLQKGVYEKELNDLKEKLKEAESNIRAAYGDIEEICKKKKHIIKICTSLRTVSE